MHNIMYSMSVMKWTKSEFNKLGVIQNKKGMKQVRVVSAL